MLLDKDPYLIQLEEALYTGSFLYITVSCNVSTRGYLLEVHIEIVGGHLRFTYNIEPCHITGAFVFLEIVSWQNAPTRVLESCCICKKLLELAGQRAAYN